MAKQNGRVLAAPAHWAAPVGGWNALDAIAAMPVTDAVRLDNMFPETSYIRLRRGSLDFLNFGVNLPVRALMTYSSATGERMMAACNGNLYDITAKTAVWLAAGQGDAWEYVNFATPGGQFWVGVNGLGQQWIWNGTGTATAGVNTAGTGVTLGPPWSMICNFQSRLFFASASNLLLYYLPVNVYQGEVHVIDLGSMLPEGGRMAFLGTWTRDDSTMGMNDLLVIGTTEGEMLVYRGVNPDDPSNWFMVGRFECGKPVAGHRQLCRLGPDMMLINEDGFQSLSNYLALGESKALTTAVSMKIGNAVTQAVLTSKDVEGWCAILFPKKNMILVNVPQPGAAYQQYVVNTITGAWCRFLNLNAYCWTVWQNQLYFGSANGRVTQADVGGSDNGQPIPFDLITAFQVFNSVTQKRATMCRPFIIASGQWYPVMDVNVDYTVSSVTSPLDVIANQTAWDQFNWDQADWATAGEPQHNWYSVDGIGTALAVRMAGTALSANLQLLAIDLSYEAAIGFV